MEWSLSSSSSSSLSSVAVLKASSVFVLLRSSLRVSRNVRSEWIFDRLRPTANPITIPDVTSLDDTQLQEDEGGLTAVGVVPLNPPQEWSWSVAHKYAYQLTTASKVTFLPQRHGLVFLLDLSLSSATFTSTVDSSFETLMETLRRCLTALLRPYVVPGSQLLLLPKLYVTVVAWTPFLCPDGQSVLVQARQLKSETVDVFLQDIALKARRFVSQSASRKGMEAEREAMEARNMNDRITGALFDYTTASNRASQHGLNGMTKKLGSNEDDEQDKCMSNSRLATTVASDSGFVDMIRSGVTAIHLMPKLISGSIIVVGDGSFSVPDVESCDMLLNQLRTRTISLSFLSSLSTLPESSRSTHGLSALTYKDLLEFVAQSTHGVALFDAPKIEFVDTNINWYHEAFLTWSFRKVKMLGKFIGLDSNIDFETLQRSRQLRAPINKYFQSEHFERSIRKTMETRVKGHFFNLLSCRLREGFVIRNVEDLDSRVIEVSLTLPWKIGSLMHYVMHASWPLRNREQEIGVNVFIEGDYETLHDIICKRNSGFVSRDRNAVSVKYANIMSHLKTVDKLLLHLNSFKANDEHYTLPDSVEKGEPLFQVGVKAPVLLNNDLANRPFALYWKPISSLDISIWHRWMHTIRIHALLYHDYPLPKHLLQPNSSGRYTTLQCRKACAQLFRLLKELSHFVLVENNSYITFLDEDTNECNQGDEDDNHQKDVIAQKARSFYLIRLTTNGPCIVLWMAFTGGTAVDVRWREIDRIKQGLEKLTIKQLVSWHQDMHPYDDHHTPSELHACRLMQKPLDKVMVRYERCPSDLQSIVNFEALMKNDFSSTQQGFRCDSPGLMNQSNSRRQSSSAYLCASAHLSLSRYLPHCRWIFRTAKTSDSLLSEEIALKTLNLLLKMRLMEGFILAHSMDGVQTMATELAVCDHSSEVFTTLLVQYVILPPIRVIYNRKDDEEQSSSSSLSSKEETSTLQEDESLQMAVEVWVEPQDGFVAETSLKGAKASDIIKIIHGKDRKVIRAITSFHFLALATSEIEVDIVDLLTARSDDSSSDDANDTGLVSNESRINHVLLSCHILDVLQHAAKASNNFAMFIQDFHLDPSGGSNISSTSEADKMNDSLLKVLASEVRRLNTTEIELPHDMTRAVNDFLDPQWQPKSTSTPVKKVKIEEEDSGLKLRQPRWRCYLRPLSSKDESCFTVTLIPYNYEAVKAFCRRRYKDDNSLFRRTTKQTTLSSLSSSSSFSSYSEESMRKRTHSADNSTVRLGDHLSVFSNDYRRSPEGKRGRCMSMDSKKDNEDNQNETKTSPPSHKASLMSTKGRQLRPRTHTYSYFNVNRPMRNASKPVERLSLLKNARGATRSNVQLTSNKGKNSTNSSNAKTIVQGSLALPVIVFECRELHFVAQLLKSQRSLNDCERNTVNQGNHEEVNNGAKNYNGDKETISKAVEAYREDLSRVFVQEFVGVLYTFLRQGLSNVHTLDVRRVLDFCTQENLTDIDLNPLLKAVCLHPLEELKVELEKPTNTSETNSNRSCSDVHSTLHRLVSKKFMDAVQLEFQLVSSSLESSLFFFAPPTSPLKSRQQRDTGSNSHRRDTRDTLFGSYTSGCHSRSENQLDDQHDEVVIEFSHDVCLRDDYTQGSDKGLTGMHRTTTSSVVDNFDDMRISYDVSNAFDSDDPSSDLNDLINDDDLNFEWASATALIPPLFLRLSTFIIAPPITNGDEFDTRPFFEKNVNLKRLPTCFLDVIEDCRMLQEDNNEWDVTKTSVSLELVCFSLAENSNDRKEDDDGDQSDNDNDDRKDDDDLTSSSSLSAYANVTFSTALSKHLNASQKRSLEVLIAETRWMIRDEVVFALARQKRTTIDRKLLDEVADHVKTSSNKPGCSYQRITLDFVMGVDQSFRRLLQKLEVLKVPGFDLLRPEDGDGKVFFVVHHEESDDGHAQESDNVQGKFCLSSSIMHCWLIVFVSRQIIEIVFQYREGQLTQVLPWRQAQMYIVNELDSILTRVNQELLLKDLYDTRRCNRLLEAENASEVWSKPDLSSNRKRTLNDFKRHVDDDVEEDDYNDELKGAENRHVLEANLKLHFEPGQFSCPILLERKLWLHPRLCQSVGRGATESQGMMAVKATLSNFAVMNRSNMFVYGDGQQNVFYFKVEEHIVQSEPTPTSSRSIATSSSFIRLQVHGVAEPDSPIISDLFSVLQYKLSELVVNNLSTVLQRNPMSKLSSEDVLFMQTTDVEEKQQDCKVTFLHLDQRMTRFFETFRFFIHQHMIQAGKFIVPKYKTNIRFHCQLHRQSNPEAFCETNKEEPILGEENTEEEEEEEEDGEKATIYLYNHLTMQSGGHRGIAVVALVLHCEDDERNKSSPNDIDYDDTILDTAQSNLQQLLLLNQEELNEDECVDKAQIHGRVSVEIRVWERGRNCNVELTKLVASYTRHAIWDVLMEQLYLKLMTTDSKALSSLLEFLDSGMQCGTSSLQRIALSLRNAAEIGLLVTDISNHMSKALTPMRIEVVNGDLQPSFIIAREMRGSERDSIAAMLKFKGQAVMDEDEHEGAANSPGQRQPFVLVHLDPVETCLLTLFFYNVTKGHTETLMRPILTTLHWIVGREALATSIVTQKLGLFYNQKLFRSKLAANSISVERTSKAMARGPLANPFLSSIKCVDLLERSKTPLSTLTRPQTRPWAQPVTEHAFRFKYHDHRDVAEARGRPESEAPKVSDKAPLRVEAHREGKTLAGDKIEEVDWAASTDGNGPKEERTCWQRLIEKDLELSRFSGDIVRNLNRLRRLRSEETHALFTVLPLSCLRFLQRVCGLVHCCYTPLLFFPRWRYEAIETRRSNRQGREDKGHDQETPDQGALLEDFFRHFEHYIYTFGFVPFRIDGADNAVSSSSKKRWLRFFHKSLPGGLLFLESGICAPFFFVRLLAVESSFLNTKKSSAPSYSVQKSRLNQCIVEEVERIKVLLQLHSFAYDYHLQAMHRILSPTSSTSAPCSFSVTPRFLISFLRYYPKSPSYCRSIVLRATEPVIVECDPALTPASVLFDYVLKTNGGALPFRVLNTEDGDQEKIGEKKIDTWPILVRQSSVRLMAAETNVNDEELDVSLIVTRLDCEADGYLKLDLFVVLAKHGRNPLRARHIQDNNSKNKLSSSGVPRASSLVQMVSLDDSEHYVGFYSTQEQLFLALARSELTSAARCVSDKFGDAITHCRRDMLWASMVERRNEDNTRTIKSSELEELLGFVYVSTSEVVGGPNLASVLLETDAQGLMQFLVQKLGYERSRGVVDQDGTITRLIIVGEEHECRKEAFVMVGSTHGGSSGCNIRFVSRSQDDLLSRHQEDEEAGDDDVDYFDLVEEVVNLVGLYLWQTLTS